MKNYLKMTVILFGLISFGHVVSKSFGFYHKYYLTDIFFHTIAGVMFGYLWFYFIKNRKLDRIVLYTSTATFAVFGSFIWEVWEFFVFKISPALIDAYEPSVSDALADISCGFFGGLVSVAIWIKYYSSEHATLS